MPLGVTESTTWVDLSKVEGVSSIPLVNAGNTLMRVSASLQSQELVLVQVQGTETLHTHASYSCSQPCFHGYYLRMTSPSRLQARKHSGTLPRRPAWHIVITVSGHRAMWAGLYVSPGQQRWAKGHKCGVSLSRTGEPSLFSWGQGMCQF